MILFLGTGHAHRPEELPFLRAFLYGFFHDFVKGGLYQELYHGWQFFTVNLTENPSMLFNWHEKFS